MSIDFGSHLEASSDITVEGFAQSTPNAYRQLPSEDETYPSIDIGGSIPQIDVKEFAEGLSVTRTDRAKQLLLAGMPVAAIGSITAGAYLLSRHINL